MKTKNITTQHLRKSIGRSHLRLGLPRVQPTWIIRGFLLIPLALVCFALSSTARALLPPPAPDGAYPGPNTAEGDTALFSLTTGAYNTAIGTAALYKNTTGSGNTATGYTALYENTIGPLNTANGASALYNNTTGYRNTGNGANALKSNTMGYNNTATGYDALVSNTIGNVNTANGLSALFNNTTGSNNTADGGNALLHNTIGGNNTAIGNGALFNNTTGSNNIGLGSRAGSALTTGSDNVCIGAVITGVAGESNTTRIGNVYSSMASGRMVYVNSDNKIGTLSSSRRFKHEINPMDKSSEPILALKPVTFRYKKEIEPNGTIMFGLIAEEVEKVDPDLVTRNAKGEAETVRYDAVNAMLLNEFLKAHRKMQEQEATIIQLKSETAKQDATIATLTESLKEQAAQIQKVSDQLEVSKPAPQMVLNNQ
jgi:hypothetical protein